MPDLTQISGGDTVAIIVLAAIFITSSAQLVSIYTNTDSSIDSLENLGKDVKDGSLDNYTQSEAQQILNKGGKKLKSPVIMFASMIFMGVSGLGLYIKIDSIRLEKGRG